MSTSISGTKNGLYSFEETRDGGNMTVTPVYSKIKIWDVPITIWRLMFLFGVI